MWEQCFTRVAAAGAGLNYIIQLVHLSSGSQHGGRIPAKGHQLNLRAREMIHGRAQKKKLRSATQI